MPYDRVTSPCIMTHSYTKEELLRLMVDLITHHASTRDMSVVVRAGVNINQSFKKGLKPLHYAAFEDNVDCLSYLIDEVHADVNICDDLGYTPLHVASKNGHYSTIKALLERGACVNFGGTEGSELSRALSSLTVTPLSLALENNHVACVAALLNGGADSNQNYFLGHEINLVPMEFDRCVEMLLLHGADPDVFSRAGLSPLMKACKDKHLKTVKVILSHGASVNLRCPPKFDEKTAIHFAAAAGDADIVETLLEAGATTTRTEEYDHSPLELAIVGDRAQVVNRLLKYGADPNDANQEHCTPLQFAVSTVGLVYQNEILESLLKHGANPNSHSRYFSYVGPSLCALVEYFCYTEEYDIRLVKLLLSYGANVNMTRPTKLLKIHDPCGILGQVRKLRPYEDIFELLLESSKTFDTNSTMKESSLSNKQKELIISAGSQPCALRHLVRLRIRETLAIPIVDKIDTLPLPSFLKQYILFNV